MLSLTSTALSFIPLSPIAGEIPFSVSSLNCWLMIALRTHPRPLSLSNMKFREYGLLVPSGERGVRPSSVTPIIWHAIPGRSGHFSKAITMGLYMSSTYPSRASLFLAMLNSSAVPIMLPFGMRIIRPVTSSGSSFPKPIRQKRLGTPSSVPMLFSLRALSRAWLTFASQACSLTIEADSSTRKTMSAAGRVSRCVVVVK